MAEDLDTIGWVIMSPFLALLAIVLVGMALYLDIKTWFTYSTTR